MRKAEVFSAGKPLDLAGGGRHVAIQQMAFDQSEFDIRCEWGMEGIQRLAGICDAIVILDVLSFSTCVSIAVTRDATVFPFRWKDDRAIDFAQSVNAVCAGERSRSGYSLAPTSLREIPAGTRLVLPSPNGATLTLCAEGDTPIFAGCLRNSGAVARAVALCGKKIGLIPAGEKWNDSHTLRPALEDLAGAGAVIRHLAGSLSPEARLAMNAFDAIKENLRDELCQCVSGRELIARGFHEDVLLAAELDVDDSAPRYSKGAYQRL